MELKLRRSTLTDVASQPIAYTSISSSAPNPLISTLPTTEHPLQQPKMPISKSLPRLIRAASDSESTSTHSTSTSTSTSKSKPEIITTPTSVMTTTRSSKTTITQTRRTSRRVRKTMSVYREIISADGKKTLEMVGEAADEEETPVLETQGVERIETRKPLRIEKLELLILEEGEGSHTNTEPSKSSKTIKASEITQDTKTPKSESSKAPKFLQRIRTSSSKAVSRGGMPRMPDSNRFCDVWIVGPGSDPKTNKSWMGDTMPRMEPGLLPVISREEQLSADELRKMGVKGKGKDKEKK